MNTAIARRESDLSTIDRLLDDARLDKGERDVLERMREGLNDNPRRTLGDGSRGLVEAIASRVRARPAAPPSGPSLLDSLPRPMKPPMSAARHA